MTAEKTSETASGGDTDVLTLWRPSPRTVIVVLVGVLGFLVVLDLAAWNSSFQAAGRFSLDGETTLPTWWASVQLLLLSVVFALVALRERRASRHKAAWTLTIGALVSASFSIDETAAIHEAITSTFRGKGLSPSFTGGRGTWIFVYGIIAIVVFAVTLTGILSLLRTDQTNTLLAALGGATFVLGGVVVEVFGYSVPSHAEVVVEETLEFLGIAIMVWAVYRMLGTTAIRVLLK